MLTRIMTEVKDVTVFRDGARITRNGKVKLAAGEQTIIAGNITHYAQEDSFRVKGRGSATLRGIDVKRVTMTFEPEGDLKAMVDELKALQKELRLLDTKGGIQERRVEQLKTISGNFSSEFGKWFAAGESSLQRLDEMDKTSLKQLLDAKKKLRDLEVEKEGLTARINAIQANINRVQGQRRVETVYEVLILVEAKEPTEIEIDVTYQLAYSGWSPTYDVDLKETTASLKRIAMVYNNSLEDWIDVSLTVSTASARPVQAIEATPFYVDVWKPVAPAAMSMATGAGLGGLRDKPAAARYEKEEAFELAEAAPVDVMDETYAEASENMSGVIVYNVPGNITINSDNDSHPVTLLQEEIESKKLHFWNAYAMPEVVAQDEITNGDSVLLPGPVKVYAGGDFIGETNLGLTSPREKFRLGTRTAYDVKAKKRLVSKETDKAGITRGKTRRDYQYSLEIESYSKSEIEIKIVDRIPHSTSEKIVVEFLQPSVAPTKNELGVLEWEIKIPSQEKRTLTYGFNVEWEKEVIVQPPLP
jgi:uncharacterized protein (TIGR02231 family)